MPSINSVNAVPVNTVYSTPAEPVVEASKGHKAKKHQTDKFTSLEVTEDPKTTMPIP